MQYSLQISDFVPALDRAFRAVPAKSTLAILESVLLRFTETDVSITGTDMNTRITTHAPAKGKTKVDVCVPARRLRDIVKMWKDGAVTFDVDVKGRRFGIKVGMSAYKLASDNADEYPAFPDVKGKSITIDALVLRDHIAHTAYAVSGDDLRPAMKGVLVKLQETGITTVATDGHRLASYSTNGASYAEKRDLIVPDTALAAIPALFTGDNVQLTYTDEWAILTQNGVTLATRLVNEMYPNWESVVPPKSDTVNTLTVNRLAMLAATKRVLLASSNLTHQVRINLGDAVTLSAEDAEAGSEGSEKVDATYEGEDMVIGMNGTFLADLLANMVAEAVTFKLASPTRAAVVIGEKEEMGLVMPCRLNS